MSSLYTTQQIREAEEVLLDAQRYPDQLMRTAAARVADEASEMVPEPNQRILLLVGPGGNGGDALYAGAELAKDHQVEAYLVASGAHEGALQHFRTAGGSVAHQLPSVNGYSLIIDGIAGLGAGRPLSEDIAEFAERVEAPILAIDIPSGVDPDTGAVPDPVVVAEEAQRVPAHIRATVTVTFGGRRIAHAIAGQHCGRVIVADIGLGEQLESMTSPYSYLDLSDTSDSIAVDVAGEPSPQDHKYSGGVVTICAGNETFQGAGELCALAAVKATSFGVRFVGNSAAMNHLPPEILRVKDLVHDYSSHAYAVGPGRGLNEWAATELRSVLESDDPVVVDADALTLLGHDEELRQVLTHREGLTVLTPHDGEFARLTDISLDDRLAAASELAEELQCYVLLKGRVTIVASPQGTATVVHTGSSWAATPGSGDVLTGILGAYVACVPKMLHEIHEKYPNKDVTGYAHQYFTQQLIAAVVVHSTAALLGARTEFGNAPVSASGIVGAIPAATAYLQRSVK